MTMTGHRCLGLNGTKLSNNLNYPGYVEIVLISGVLGI